MVFLSPFLDVTRMSPSSDPPPPFNYLTLRGGIGKIKKSGWKYGAGAVVPKMGGGLALFLFNFFKVYHFYI